ncbi:MAG: hypothetical protein V4864_05640 [Pseudomonadota bacterium]
MTDIALEPQKERRATAWVLAALACWGLSLLLPGFMVDTRAAPWFGGAILLMGLLFGWMVQGWAVYANLFFAVAAIALMRGRTPRLSIIAMLALAATLPLYRGVIQDEGSGTILPVASWGWGALLWLASLVLLATATALRRGLLSPAGARNVAFSLGACLFAAVVLHVYQRSFANDQERAVYLSPSMIFTKASFCGVALTPVAAPVVPPGTIVRLDVDPQLREPGSSPYLWLPKLSNDQQGGFSWVSWQDLSVSSVHVKVQMDAAPGGPQVEARKTADGAVVRVLAAPGGRILYEQRLRATTGVNGHRIYCPMSTQFGFKGLQIGYDTQLLRALGEGSQASRREISRDEVARTPCDPGAQDLDGVQGLQLWDGRKVILQPESIRTRKGFCSDSYVVLVYVSDHSAAGVPDMSPVAQVFDRRTLRPLAVFNDRRVCPHPRCAEAPRDLATGVRIADMRLVVESGAGDLAATRYERP